MMVCFTLCLTLCMYLCEALAENDSNSILEDNGVLVLTEGNFERALKQYNQLLVHFCEYIFLHVFLWLFYRKSRPRQQTNSK